MRKTIVEFRNLPIQVEMRAPIPDGKGQTIAYSNMAMVATSVELLTPVRISVETPDEDARSQGVKTDSSKESVDLELVAEALRQYSIMVRQVITDQFLGWVDEVEGLMEDRMELRL